MASHDVPIGATQVSLAALNERSREIFRSIVESYLATGEPVGSRTLSRRGRLDLSPASIRRPVLLPSWNLLRRIRERGASGRILEGEFG